MLRLHGITVNCDEPSHLAHFWGQALGYRQRDLWEPYAGITDPSGRGPNVTFQRSSNYGNNQLHLDLYSHEPDADAERLEELGAVKGERFSEGDTFWWVMRDPGGNEFCVVAAIGADRSID